MGIDQNLFKMTLSFEGHLLLMLVITFLVISKLVIIQLLTACGYWPKFVQDDLVFWRSFIVDARDYISGNQQARDYTALDCLWVLTKICARWPCFLKVIYCWCSWLYLKVIYCWCSWLYSSDCLWVLTKICARWPCLLKVIYCWCSRLYLW